MTTIAPQPLSRAVRPQHLSSDEPTNARTFAQRSSTSPPAITRQPRTNIPPHAPSPPSHTSRLPPAPSPPTRSSQYFVEHDTFVTMVVESFEPLNQWIFTEPELRMSPSIQDGLSFAEESERRAKGVNFIVQAGILLKLPQITLGTAAIFLHRFYMRKSMVVDKDHSGIHHYNIAATALFLATKAEETCRKTKEIVIAVAKVAQKNSSLIIDEQSKEFWRWKDSILMYEETMLELLTFDVVVESPYNCLYEFLQTLQVEGNKDLRNVAWAFINDTFMTMLCLLVPTRDIAVAAVFWSLKFHKTSIPDNSKGDPWWIAIGGIPEKIFKAVDFMAEFYSENPLRKGDLNYEQSPGNPAEDLQRTRMIREATISPNARIEEENAAEQAEMRDPEHSNGIANGVNQDGEEKPLAEFEQNGVAGDSDTQLKAIANDPATHEPTANDTGLAFIANGSNGVPPKSTVKRKESESQEEPEAKRSKLAEDSEEGEIEE